MTTATSGGCCVCGRAELPHPDVELSRQLGSRPPKPEKVTWRCQACKRLVCRDHVFTVATGMQPPFDREIPVKTLCTEPGCVETRARGDQT